MDLQHLERAALPFFSLFLLALCLSFFAIWAFHRLAPTPFSTFIIRRTPLRLVGGFLPSNTAPSGRALLITLLRHLLTHFVYAAPSQSCATVVDPSITGPRPAPQAPPSWPARLAVCDTKSLAQQCTPHQVTWRASQPPYRPPTHASSAAQLACTRASTAASCSGPVAQPTLRKSRLAWVL
jgi:hypothetical protein